MILDYSAERVPSSPKVKMKDGKPVLFAPGDVRGIMIHQTDCYFVDPSKPHDAVTNEWRARRALKVAAHITVFRNGLVAVSAPLDWVMNHGNAPNSFCWGIEVEGRFAGSPYSARNPEQMPLTYQAVDGLHEAIGYLCDAAETIPQPLTTLLAHRQSSETRRSDPGFEVWNVVRNIAECNGVFPDLLKTWGTGRPIPWDWDARASKQY